MLKIEKENTQEKMDSKKKFIFHLKLKLMELEMKN